MIRYRHAAEALANAAGELLFESNRSTPSNDALSGLAVALRNFRLIEREYR